VETVYQAYTCSNGVHALINRNS